MTLRLYNTLTRCLKDFVPLAPPKVTMYVCGPTVYDVPHIGHARSAYIFDVLRRYLRHKGYQVTFVRNVTDVDDKIIQKAAETGRPPAAVAETYLKAYHDAMDRLGIEPPDVEPRATEHVVPVMTDLIAKLLMQGAAYEAGGDVYFAVRKFPGYGTLSNRTLDELQAGARVEPGEHKQDPLDFALWKAAKPGEPSWSSPWGPGRPGWHIECSAMSTKELGDTFDIHGGGVDLVFPHHENEIAQAQAVGKPFAKYWIHNGLLTVNGEKMSKSLGNYITVERALEQCHNDISILKVFFLGAHYRSPVDYSEKNLRTAAGRSNRWYDFLSLADTQRSTMRLPVESPSEITQFQEEYGKAMDNDLNTPEALAAFDRLINAGYKWWKELEASNDKEAPAIRGRIVIAADAIRQLAKGVFGLTYFQPRQLTEEDKELLALYEGARQKKDFQVSDKLRKELEKRGFIIQDTRHGSLPIPKR